MKIWKATEFAAQDFPAPAWVVPELLPGFGITMVYAYAKIGKSLMAIQLAHALTTDKDFLGVKPERPWKVLYIQCDLPAGEWAQQIKKTGIGEGWDTVHEEIGLLGSTKIMKELYERVRDDKYDLTIWDALYKLSNYANLEEPKVIGWALKQINSVAGDFPAILIHHKRKGMPGVTDHTSVSAAGSFALSAGVSTLYDLSDANLKIRGRYITDDLDLKRAKNGTWIAKNRGDIFDR